MRILLVLYLLTLSGSTLAQLRLTAQDSVAIFVTEADEYTRSREFLRAKGRVTYITARPEGGLAVSVLRQHIGYLRADKAADLRSGINTLPALWQVIYQNGRLQAPTEQFINLNSGLSQPFSYTFSTIGSLTGGFTAKGQPITPAQSVELSDLLQRQPAALGYAGPEQAVANVTRPYRPLLAGYGPAVRLAPPATPRVRFGGTITDGPYGKNTLTTIDSLGNKLRDFTPEGVGNRVLVAYSEVRQPNPAPAFALDEANPLVGADWLFGPAISADIREIGPKRRKPQLLLVRTDPKGQVVFQQMLAVEYEDYAFTGATLASHEGGALIVVTLGKGLLKYQLAYAYVTPTGVAWQRVWDKKDPAQVRVGRQAGPFRAFENMRGLVALPGGELALWHEDLFMATGNQPPQFGGYGLTHIGKDGSLLRYHDRGYSIRLF